MSDDHQRCETCHMFTETVVQKAVVQHVSCKPFSILPICKDCTAMLLAKMKYILQALHLHVDMNMSACKRLVESLTTPEHGRTAWTAPYVHKKINKKKLKMVRLSTHIKNKNKRNKMKTLRGLYPADKHLVKNWHLWKMKQRTFSVRSTEPLYRINRPNEISSLISILYQVFTYR